MVENKGEIMTQKPDWYVKAKQLEAELEQERLKTIKFSTKVLRIITRKITELIKEIEEEMEK